METRNGTDRNKTLPETIQIASQQENNNNKKGKRPRDNCDEEDHDDASEAAVGSVATLPDKKKPCTQQQQQQIGTPLTSSPSPGMSSHHSVAHSIVTGGSSRPPPPPPPTPPPQPSQIVKVLYLGSESSTRQRWILNLTRRQQGATFHPHHHAPQPSTTPTKATSPGEKKKQNPYSLEYHRKDYTFHSASGEEKSVRMQFLHLDGTPPDTPPDSWEDTRHKIDAALLVLDLRHVMELWETSRLEAHLEKWRNSVTLWTHHKVPLDLILVNVSHDAASTPGIISAALLLRLGAAIASACRRARFHCWFMLGRPENNETTAQGLDSVDAVLQCLVEQAEAFKSDSSVAPSRGDAASTTSDKRSEASSLSLLNKNASTVPPNKSLQSLKTNGGGSPPEETLRDKAVANGVESSTNSDCAPMNGGKKKL